MGEPRSGPCSDWITAEDVFDCGPCSDIEVGDRNMTVAAEMVDVASRILFVRSRFRYPGSCEVTIRPHCARHAEHPCGCGGVDRWKLPYLPVSDVTAVKVDGVTLTEGTDYRLDDFGWLVRIDGDGWPSSQRLDLADTAAETWSVAFVYGRTPPADGILAAKRLACELYQACVGADSCELPAQVQSIVRQGVQIGFEDISAMFSEGRLGIREVDWFLDTETFGHTDGRAVIVNPDSMPVGHRHAT